MIPPILSTLAALLLPLLRINVVITLTAIAAALPIACLFAAARLSPWRMIHAPATAYVNVLRSSPLVMIMFWAYTIGPIVTGHPNSAYISAVLALSAFEVAYFTEIVRAGLQSVAAGQRNAALATGLTRSQAMRLILLPQALRRMLPSLLTQSLIAFQDSTIASIISVPDVMQTTNVINAREQDPVTLYAMLAALFFVICYALSRIIRHLEHRTRRQMALA
ncbi:MAG TPA: amino acid ABC transporter permease [Acetobacteraceae bacterium]|nr:amino acid ABC transporter permease [Acetobacteraceae bacterium]